MKYLEIESLSKLTNFLTGLEVGQRVLDGRVEAYSCKLHPAWACCTQHKAKGNAHHPYSSPPFFEQQAKLQAMTRSWASNCKSSTLPN